MGCQERLDLTAQSLIARTGTVEPLRPLRGRPADAVGEKLFDTRPA